MDDIAPHVPHSELLLAAKAEGLLRLGKHERAREFCGQAVHLDDGAHREVRPWQLLLAKSRRIFAFFRTHCCTWTTGRTER